MRGILATGLAAVLLATASPARAVDPPYLKLAQALGTPELADSYGPRDKSRLLLHFVPRGQTAKNWKKMTTVSIVKVTAADTDVATRGVITRLDARLKARRANVRVFDRSLIPPITCYFEFSAGGETQKGIVYSPDPGFVTVAQVGAKNGGSVGSDDVKKLKSIIRR